MSKFNIGDTVKTNIRYRGSGVIENTYVLDKLARYYVRFKHKMQSFGAWFTEDELELVSTAPRKDDMYSYNKVPFSLAISWLQQGIKMKREAWQNDVFIKEVKFNGFEPTLVTYYGKDGENGKTPGGFLDWDDMIANDWVIVE